MTISSLPLNLSLRLVVTLLTAAIAWLVTRYAIELPEGAAEAVALAVAGLLGYRAPAGDVVGDEGPPSDQGLSLEQAAAGTPPTTDPELIE
jgi:hypothetical protein